MERPNARGRWRVGAAVLVISLIFVALFEYSRQNGYRFSSSLPSTPSTAPPSSEPSKSQSKIDKWCPLPPLPKSADDGLKDSARFTEDSFRKRQVDRLSAAVNVSTQSFDDSGSVESDPRWESFNDLHEILKKLFPLVHEKVELENINRYGLLYTWKGSTADLKPILFTAHQDVVPSGPEQKWTYPPFSAHYDGHFVWGRGASDCKNNLIGLLSTFEDLLSQNWTPKRTIMLGFGFDEEISGPRGAGHISQHLQQKLGKDSLAMIHDEGGMGLQELGDKVYALPAVAEKGFVDIVIQLEVKGGHSSRPPSHSGIGIASELVVELEKNPFVPRLADTNPFKNLLQCQIRHSPDEVEQWLPDALAGNEDEVKVGKELAESRGPDVRFSIQTSQAVDIIHGGEKDNQLPDSINVTVNYRIAPHESVDIVKSNIAVLLSPIAKKHKLVVQGFGYDEQRTQSAIGIMKLSSHDDLNPSPVSPTADFNPVWQLFGGTVRQVFEDVESYKGKTVIPAGDIMLGNTDTIHYWNLTRNIYRFSPARTGTRINVHTIDERIDMDAHLEGMRLYYELMRNFDLAPDS